MFVFVCVRRTVSWFLLYILHLRGSKGVASAVRFKLDHLHCSTAPRLPASLHVCVSGRHRVLVRLHGNRVHADPSEVCMSVDACLSSAVTG